MAKDDSSGITLQMIMDHLQAVHVSLRSDMKGLGDRLERVENRVILVSAQIDAIDKRLDTIEIEELPKRVRQLEKAVFPVR
jgi:hypothetical protein